MDSRARPFRQLAAIAFGWAAFAAVAQGHAEYRNVTAGGGLRPGIQGRMDPPRHRH